MYLRAACLFVFLALAFAGDATEDTKDAIYLKALKPGSNKNKGENLGIKCTFDRSKTKIQSVAKLEILASPIGEDSYTTVASIAGDSVSSEDDVTAEGEIQKKKTKKSKLQLIYSSADVGYCMMYKCMVTGTNKKDESKSIYKTYKMKAKAGESGCNAQKNEEATAELESQVEECKAELAEKSTELDEKSTELDEKAKELAAKSAELAEKSSALDAKANELAQKTAELAQKSTALSRLEGIDGTKYHLSSVYKGSVYITKRASARFNIQANNEECKAMGGYLVEFDDQAEQQFVGNFVRSFGRAWYFTGASDVATEGKFVYYNSKKPMTGIKWRPREPNQWGGNEDCVDVNYIGLNDIGCAATGRYICEIPLM